MTPSPARWLAHDLIALTIIALIVIPWTQARSQEAVFNTDYFGYPQPWYPWSLELNPGFARALKADGWKDYYFSSTLSWQPEAFLRLDGSAEIHRTIDPLFVNATELRVGAQGALIWPTQGRYLNLYMPEFNVRYEYRHFNYDGDVADEATGRLRLQLSGRFTIGDTTMSIGTWYVPWAVESYSRVEGDPKERSAYLWRWRAGVGCVISGFLRAELHYIAARRRDTTGDPFELSSRTIWLAIRNYY